MASCNAAQPTRAPGYCGRICTGTIYRSRSATVADRHTCCDFERLVQAHARSSAVNSNSASRTRSTEPALRATAQSPASVSSSDREWPPTPSQRLSQAPLLPLHLSLRHRRIVESGNANTSGARARPAHLQPCTGGTSRAQNSAIRDKQRECVAHALSKEAYLHFTVVAPDHGVCRLAVTLAPEHASAWRVAFLGRRTGTALEPVWV